MKFNMKWRVKWQFVTNVFNGVYYRDVWGNRVNKITGGRGMKVLNRKKWRKERNEKKRELCGKYGIIKKAINWGTKRDKERCCECEKRRQWAVTCSCCWRANSICCLCFSICEAASFFCSSWAARSCSRRLISWVIIVESWCSFSARLSGVPSEGRERAVSGVKRLNTRWRAWVINTDTGMCYAFLKESTKST